MSDKPIVFNYKDHEDLKALADKQMWSIMRLKEENTNLKLQMDAYEQLMQVIHTQQETISTYGKIFKMQEAELKALRGDESK